MLPNQQFPVTFILILSIAVQVTAAFLALRLINMTGRRLAWGFIALALVLMAVRRVIPLYHLLSGDSSTPPDTWNELIGLVLSVCMAIGIARITPIFTERKQAEDSLRASSRYSRSLIEASLDPLATISPDGKITDVNQATEAITGVPRAQLIGDDFSNYFTMPEKARDGYQKVLTEGSVRDYPLTIRHTSGNTTDVLYNATVYKNEAGEIEGVFAAARDITKRKQVLEQLAYQAELLSNVHDAIVGTDENLKVTYWNKAATEIFGWTSEGALGRDAAGLFGTQVQNSSRAETIAGLMAIGKYDGETLYARKDGTYINVHVKAAVLKGDQGEFKGLVTSIRDITPRKRAEEALRESEERYRLLFDTSLDAILLTIPDGNILAANPAACRMFGRTEAEIQQVGRGGIVDVTDPRLGPALEKRARTGYFQGELTMLRKDGTKFPGEISTAMFKDKEGHDRSSMLIRDISERKRMEEELRASEIHFQQTLDNMLEGCMIIGFDWTYLYVNESAARHGHIERANLTGHTLLEMYPGIEDTEIFTHYRRAMQERVSQHFQSPYRFPDGTSSWYEFSVEPTPEGIFVLTLDITERKRAEEALRDSEVRFRVLSDNSLVGVYILQNGRLTYVNSALARIFGYKPDELIGADPLIVIHPADQALVSENIRRRIAGEVDTAQYEFRGRRKSGETRFVEVLGARVDFSGQPAIIGNIVDITDRKRAEEEIARSLEAEKKAREVAEILREASESLSRTLDLDDVLQNILRYLGHLIPYDSANVMLLDYDAQLRGVAVRGYERWTNVDMASRISFDPQTTPHLNEIITTRQSILVPNTFDDPRWVRIPGAEHVVSWLGVPIIANGQSIGLYSFDKAEPGFFTQEHCRLAEGLAGQAAVAIQNARLHDQIKRANAELEQRVIDRTAQLEAANRELEAFAYSVSHDLRAPLRHIDGFLEMLQKRTKSSLDEQSQHYMEVIADSSQKMGTLIDDLLSFSRMGRNELVKTNVDLEGLTWDVIQEFSPETEGRNIEWQVAALPQVTGDRAMLRVVLVNLISNALKFTSQCQQAKIEIGCMQGSPQQALIFVRDNGVGFDMHYVDKLFNVFQRLHRAEDFEGTGIGLATIRRIIHRHGGRTWAEGEVGHGATFYFSLPTSR